VKFLYNETKIKTFDNYMDRWVLSFTQSLIKFVKREMAAYRLYTVVPRLVRFVDQLTKWYVRMNRKRLKVDVHYPEKSRDFRLLPRIAGVVPLFQSNLSKKCQFPYFHSKN
jgi:isoleucyl-tRNA synthetase